MCSYGACMLCIIKSYESLTITLMTHMDTLGAAQSFGYINLERIDGEL